MRFSCGIIALLISSIVGCAGVTHNTPSGKPEVTIGDVKGADVRAYLTDSMVNWKYTITRQSESALVFDRPTDNMMAAMAFGSNYDSQPNARISYTINEHPTFVRVIADLAIITNPGSAFERRSDLNNNKDSLDIQTMLDRMKTDLERRNSPATH